MSTDPEHRFELALQLQRLDLAHAIAKELQSEDKWRLLADLSLQASKFALAEECMWSGQDLNGLLLLYTSLASSQGLARLGQAALDTGKTNVAFVCFLLTQQLERCIDLLCSTGRVPEAAFFARTYLPSQVGALSSFPFPGEFARTPT
jgi:coatomer subunit beta'